MLTCGVCKCALTLPAVAHGPELLLRGHAESGRGAAAEIGVFSALLGNVCAPVCVEVENIN
jgi:hypothetical protein